jgi:hypothetical protein
MEDSSRLSVPGRTATSLIPQERSKIFKWDRCPSAFFGYTNRYRYDAFQPADTFHPPLPAFPPNRYKNFRLPGLDKYTPEQLFFISYGRLWCSKVRPEAEIQLLQTDTHSPAKWRINAPVMNLPEFSEVFKCKAGKSMNPVKKCELW